MDYKGINKTVYNKFAKEFEEQTKICLKIQILPYAEYFITNLPGIRVLDLGSGPGRDSLFFKERKLNPLCFDISSEMIKLCKEKGLEAQIGDIENMPFDDNSFDGVWACTSLLHIPKRKLKWVLDKINKILVSRGIFYLGMKEGNFEGFVESDKYPSAKRFFVLYSPKELTDYLIEANFKILRSSKSSLGDANFLHYITQKI